MFNLNFQDPATFAMEKVIALHHTIQFYLLVVLTLVFWMIISIVKDFGLNMHLTKQNLTSSSSLENVFFNRISNLKLRPVLHGTALEIIWTLVPTLVLVFIAIPSFSLLYFSDFSDNCSFITVKVIGHQWYWSYELNNLSLTQFFTFDSYLVDESSLEFGTPRLLTVDNVLLLPVNLPIRFLVTSTDVLHCWAVPSFGIKIDAVPGRLNKGVALVRREGIFYGQCSELCGVNHGFMPICLYVVDLTSFDEWTVKQVAATI